MWLWAICFARILCATLLVAAAITRPATAFANDLGSLAAIASIRHDLPLLLAAPLQDTRLRPTVDWVVADSKDAVAMWHAGQNQGVVALRIRSGRWWWRGAAVMTPGDIGVWTPMSIPGNRITLCYHYALMPGPPSAHELLAQGLIDKALANQLSGRLTATPHSNRVPLVLCDPDPNYVKSESGGYDATFSHKQDVGWKWFTLSGKSPPSGQRAAIPGATPYYLFSLSAWTSDGAVPPTVQTFATDSTFEVWFPFVLPRDKNYTLQFNDVVPRITELSGTLKNNVLRFVLPPFTLRKGVIAHGEIDAASY
jgi:hypothetical protein